MPFFEKVAYGTAIRDHDVAVAPLFPQNMNEQFFAAATRFSLVAVIGAHDLFYSCFLHQFFEGGQVSLPQVSRSDVFGIERMAIPFGPAMHGKMLGAGVQFVIVCSCIALQTENDSYTHTSGEVRVFSVGLLTASPAGIAKNIDVGRPKCKTLISL